MGAGWVSFAAVKAAVGLQAVLESCGVMAGLRRSGPQQYRGRCPIHGGGGREAFRAHLGKNAFHCFACGAGGNVLDFVAAMEECSVREAARRLQGRFPVGGSAERRWPRPLPEFDARKLVTKKTAGNAPLPFRLSAVDAAHPYITERGLRRATAAWFGIGYYAGRGILRGRVVIPIHDEHGQLVAYCGRSVNGAERRYQFPAGFRKSGVLFNYHRAVASAQQSVVAVEGFFDCMRVHQAGFPSVVALMGAALSPRQEKLLVEDFRQVVLMLDGDATGRRASCRVAEQLRSQCSVQQLALAPGTQPDQMSEREICHVLDRAWPDTKQGRLQTFTQNG